MILRSVFTIRVCLVLSVPCQNRDFNNLGCTFLILLTIWSDCYKTSHACLEVVVLAIILKMQSSRH